MRGGEFIERFLERPGKSRYVDLGPFDCGITGRSLFVRDKAKDTVTQFPLPGLQIRLRTSTGRDYYVLVSGLFLLVIFFVAFFMVKAIELDRGLTETYVILGAFLAITASPFVARLFTHGYRIVILYFLLSTVFAVLIGGWERYVPVEGFAALLAIGILPYLGSRLFAQTWREAELSMKAGDKEAIIVCSQSQAERLARTIPRLGDWAESVRP